MRLLILLLFPISLSTAMAEPRALTGASDHWEKLQRMVQVGIITPEAATQEKINTSLSKSSNARKAAQRSLASVNPELHPHKVERLRAPDLEVVLD
jgi:hypothetical protein